MHEPRVFRRDRDELSKQFTRILGEFLVCLQGKDEPSVPNTLAVADRDALRRRYGHEFAEILHQAKRRNLALEGDDQAMYKRIDEVYRELDMRTWLTTPMNELADGLGVFDFTHIGACAFGEMWLAVNGQHWLAIAVSDTSICSMWHDLGDVPQLLHEIDSGLRKPQCRQPKWTMNEVTHIIRGMRWQKLQHPTTAQVKHARSTPPPVKRRIKLFARV